jgi:hypothetical protein
MLRKASLRVAIENITRWGDTDVFPKPFENHVIAAMPKEFEDLRRLAETSEQPSRPDHQRW